MIGEIFYIFRKYLHIKEFRRDFYKIVAHFDAKFMRLVNFMLNLTA